MKLLLIEDDRSIAEMLNHAFTANHWVIERAEDGETALEWVACQEYDLILLDLNLPEMDGIAVCKRLRSGGYRNPILLLTGQDSVEAQIAGLDAGANDYITKPFDLNILLARVRVLVRKAADSPVTITWEAIAVDSRNSEVRCNGYLVHLTAKEYCLLELFLLNPKRIYSRRAILDRLWNFAETPGEETVSTHIKCIRQKLKAAGGNDPIETVYGLGYRLRPAQDASTKSTASPSSQFANAQEKAQAVTSKVWNQFKAQYLEQINTLNELVSNIQPAIASPQIQEAKQLAHKLIGSMGMFGLAEASQQARHLEGLMQTASVDAAQLTEAKQLIASINQAIAQAQVNLPTQPPASSALATPLATTTQLLIVDDDLALADRIRIEAIAWNIQVEMATDLEVARQMIVQMPPSLILLDLNFPGEEDGFTLMQELDQRSSKIPVVVFSAREELRDRVAASRLGVRAFLQKPLPAQEVLKTVSNELNRTQNSDSGDRILIVDDDPGFLKAMSILLKNKGMQVTTSDNPKEFLKTLAESNPNALVLDLEMPEFDGLELCQVVRADPRWRSLKVIFLSAHTEPETIAKAYAAGADDYFNKAVPATELVTRILYRIQQQ